MWLITEFQPTALFSLKPAWATSSGGKSLLVPTPYAIKMALLDAACRTSGVRAAEEAWPWLRDMAVALRPPRRVVVTKTFVKILKPRRKPAAAREPDAGPLGKTIAFREYVYHADPMGIALARESAAWAHLEYWLVQINYLGKRGGFVQVLAPPSRAETLPPGYTQVDGDPGRAFLATGIIQQLDDCAPDMTFEAANIYSGRRIQMGKDRLLRHVVLPYRLVRSSRSFSYYERIDT